MSFLENIKESIYKSLDYSKQEFYSKGAALRILLISNSAFFLLISIYKFFTSENNLALAALGSSIILLIIFLYFNESKRIRLAISGFVLSFLFYFIFIYFNGDFYTNLTFFIPILPAIILLLVDKQKLAYLFIFLVFLLVLFWFYKYGYLKEVSSIQILLFYIVVAAFISHFKLLFYKNLTDLQKQVFLINEEKDKNKQFLEKMSYQMRIPLNNIIGMNDFFSKTELDDVQQDYLDTINASAYMLLDSVELLENKKVKIRSYTKEEGSRFNFPLTLNNFANIANTQDSNTLISIELDKNIPEKVIGNPIKLKQILFLLIESSKKYNLENELRITINFKLEKIQENTIYFKLNFTRKGKTHIANIGLMERHSQEELINLLDLKSARDNCISMDSSFYVSVKPDETNVLIKGFFTKISQKKEESSIQNPVREVKQGTTHKVIPSRQFSDMNEILRSANILLVEDNLINQKVILLALENHVANIDTANNGKEALDAFGSNKYDLILMDIQMPVMDGIKASQKIRELEKTSQTYTPIIAVTANALQGDRNICLDAGMDEYLSKPINIEKLKSMTAQLIAQHTK